MSAVADQYKVFFDELRGSSVFPRKVRQSAVEAIHCIIDECIKQGVTDFRQIAYILATPRGEVGQFYRLVREGFAKTDEGSIRAVTSLHRRGKITRNYALRHPKTGKSYFGRGWPQLTHHYNYLKYERLTGLPLTTQPELMLTKEVSAFVLVHGMRTGGFTGKKLSDYFGPDHTYWRSARRTVNGMDKADKFARFAIDFHKALKRAFPSGKIPESEDTKMQKPASEQPIPAAHPQVLTGQSGGVANNLIAGALAWVGARLFGGEAAPAAPSAGGDAVTQGAEPANAAFDACFAAIQSGGLTGMDFAILGGAAVLAVGKVKFPVMGRISGAISVLTGSGSK